MISSFQTWKEFVKSDLYRYEAKNDLKSLIKTYFIQEGFRYNFWLKTNNYLENIKNKFFLLPFYLITKLIQRHFKFELQIHSYGKIDKGLIYHIFPAYLLMEMSLLEKTSPSHKGFQ